MGVSHRFLGKEGRTKDFADGADANNRKPQAANMSRVRERARRAERRPGIFGPAQPVNSQNSLSDPTVASDSAE
jgi:hypothetical protein